MNTRMPILWRFFIVIIFFLIVPIGVFTLILQQQLQNDYRNRIQSLLENAANGFDSMVANELDIARTFVTNISLDTNFITSVKAALDQGLASLPGLDVLDVHRDYSIQVYQRFNPRPVVIGRPMEVLDSADFEAMGALSDQQAGFLVLDNQGVWLSVTGSLDFAGLREGFLVYQYRIHETVFQNARATFSMGLGLLDPRTGRAFHSDMLGGPQDVLTEIPPSDILDEYLQVGGGNRFTEQFHNGVRKYSLFTSSRGGFRARTIINVTMPVSETRPFDASLYLVLLAFMTTMMASISSVILLRRVVRPLSYLSSEINRLRYKIRNGEKIPDLELGTNDEISDVAQTFNSLVRDLLDSRQKIEEQRAQIVSYAQNLEERVQERTRELEEAKIRAEIASAQKSRFLVNMNHELRTPLNSIAGITELLRFGAYDKTSEWAALLLGLVDQLEASQDPKEEAIRRFLGRVAETMALDGNPRRVLVSELVNLNPGINGNPDLEDRLSAMDSLLDEEERSTHYAFETILDASQSLINIINEVINLSRIESGVIEVHRSTLRLQDIINSCMAHGESYLRVKGKSKAIELTLSVDLRIPELVYADGQKIKQILLNYLTNAIKYTESGTVVVKVSLEDALVPQAIRFSVSDTGRGIEDADKPFLFMEFSRAFEVREIEGTGLGLALSRKLAERMGGSVGVESTPNRGSTFWFLVPLVDAPQGESSSKGERGGISNPT